MGGEPLVSVIIPSYNHGSFIGAAVNSALNQSYRDVEVLVVDNHSTDNTLEELGRIKDPRLRIFQFENRGMIAAGRNFGVHNSQGEYLAFLDSDDVWLPKKLEKQLPHLRDDNVILVGANCFPLGDVAYYREHLSFSGRAYLEFNYIQVLQGNPAMTSSVVVHRCYFEDAKGFNEAEDCRFIEDWELWLRLALRGRLRILSDRLFGYRIIRDKPRDARDVTLRSLELVKKQYALGQVDKASHDIAVGNCYVRIGKAHLDYGDAAGIRYYLRGMQLAGDWAHRVRGLAGLCIFFLPRILRPGLMRFLYQMSQLLRTCFRSQHEGEYVRSQQVDANL